jgi:hypothetical protein
VDGAAIQGTTIPLPGSGVKQVTVKVTAS